MGSLKPGATYIYERADGVVYAREFGAQPSERFAIGWDYDTQQRMSRIKEDKLWEEIRQAAKSNPVLQSELDRVKIVYELSKKDGQE